MVIFYEKFVQIGSSSNKVCHALFFFGNSTMCNTFFLFQMCANNAANSFNQFNTTLMTNTHIQGVPTTVTEVLAALVALTDATLCP